MKCLAISSSAFAENLSSNMQVPIQRLRKQGPAGATPAAKPPSRKRARQAAAGATALLGLFSFFVLAGPFAGISMLPVRTSLVSEGSMSPGTPSVARQGRVLTTVEDMLPLHTMQQTSVLHTSGPEPGLSWQANKTEPALLMPTDLEAQALALQQLKVKSRRRRLQMLGYAAAVRLWMNLRTSSICQVCCISSWAVSWWGSCLVLLAMQNAAPAALLGSYEAESQAQPGHLPGWRVLPGDSAALDGDLLSSSVGTPNTCRSAGIWTTLHAACAPRLRCAAFCSHAPAQSSSIQPLSA